MNFKFTRIVSFIPVKRNALIFSLALTVILYFMKIEFFEEEKIITIYLKLFAWLLGVFLSIVIGLGFMYTLICFIHFIINQKRIIPKIDIGLDGSVKGKAGYVPIIISLPRALLPLLGYIKVRIEFNDGSISDTIVLNKYSKGFEKLLPKEGASLIWLPDRKQYHVKGFIISFIDYLQFFRFTSYKKTRSSFYLHSAEVDVPLDEINPSKTKEEVEKVRTTKKVKGDFLNYKDFETGDDVRRIVWKIFAKNRELVIRIPEIMNPYASHVNFYTSFYNLISKDLSSKYATSMLNYYKDIVYNVCLSIKKTDKKVAFNIDQEVNEFVAVNEKDRVGFLLSSAIWQNNFSVNELKSARESVICVSTLIRAEELSNLIEKSTSNIIIVKVTHHLDNLNLFSIKNLFLSKDQKSELSKLRWMLSDTRRKVKRNEKEIEALISNANFTGQII